MTYSPERYQANKEAIKAAQKRYYQKTRETRLAKQKAYDQEHKEQIAARHKEKRYGRKSRALVDASTQTAVSV
ncbi:hypothetical protein PHMEG_00020631 [Phytophthora megakarya]|uniref:Uncharacterized protein n=1 Tax=Phytophthora megakarya TaxID=4795 RepID=A0A225VNB3_9STRA|nr:hypothetical protein PHMEG_00020631 [Phytophthora megakarya]